jgi:RNA polymerase sigma factor (TIGR02999 family)
MHEITRILNTIENGDSQAASQLLPLVYDELRRLSAQKLAQEKPGQTLQATALVHEAYLRLLPSGGRESPEKGQHWSSRRHFFAAAAEAMRRILIEQARRKGRLRHGGKFQRVDLLDVEVAVTPGDGQIVLLDEALTKLAGIRPQAAEVVQLRFFTGLTIDETAAALSLSPRTARRLWVFARAWLRREMGRATPREP